MKVAYYYDAEAGNHYYGTPETRCHATHRLTEPARLAGQGHPMKPQRMRMTHDLLLKYDALSQMEARAASRPLGGGASVRALSRYVSALRVPTSARCNPAGLARAAPRAC